MIRLSENGFISNKGLPVSKTRPMTCIKTKNQMQKQYQRISGFTCANDDFGSQQKTEEGKYDENYNDPNARFHQYHTKYTKLKANKKHFPLHLTQTELIKNISIKHEIKQNALALLSGPLSIQSIKGCPSYVTSQHLGTIKKAQGIIQRRKTQQHTSSQNKDLFDQDIEDLRSYWNINSQVNQNLHQQKTIKLDNIQAEGEQKNQNQQNDNQKIKQTSIRKRIFNSLKKNMQLQEDQQNQNECADSQSKKNNFQKKEQKLQEAKQKTINTQDQNEQNEKIQQENSSNEILQNQQQDEDKQEKQTDLIQLGEEKKKQRYNNISSDFKSKNSIRPLSDDKSLDISNIESNDQVLNNSNVDVKTELKLDDSLCDIASLLQAGMLSDENQLQQQGRTLKRYNSANPTLSTNIFYQQKQMKQLLQLNSIDHQQQRPKSQQIGSRPHNYLVKGQSQSRPSTRGHMNQMCLQKDEFSNQQQCIGAIPSLIFDPNGLQSYNKYQLRNCNMQSQSKATNIHLQKMPDFKQSNSQHPQQLLSIIGAKSLSSKNSYVNAKYSEFGAKQKNNPFFNNYYKHNNVRSAGVNGQKKKMGFTNEHYYKDKQRPLSHYVTTTKYESKHLGGGVGCIAIDNGNIYQNQK